MPWIAGQAGAVPCRAVRWWGSALLHIWGQGWGSGLRMWWAAMGVALWGAVWVTRAPAPPEAGPPVGPQGEPQLLTCDAVAFVLIE